MSKPSWVESFINDREIGTYGPIGTLSSNGVWNGSRGLFCSGSTSIYYNVIDYVTIAITSNSFDFGDLTHTAQESAAASNGSTGLICGGHTYYNLVDSVIFSQLSNATDVGDLSLGRTTLSACSDGIKMLVGGGQIAANTPTSLIDYSIFSTNVNFLTFGNLSGTKADLFACSNKYYAVFVNGNTMSTGLLNVIEYVITSTLSNAFDFGDTEGKTKKGSAVSNDTRGVCFIGFGSSTSQLIDYLVFATKGNAARFGSLFTCGNGVESAGACSNNVRGIVGGGNWGTGYTNLIGYITIATNGDAAQFGRLCTKSKSFIMFWKLINIIIIIKESTKQYV